MYPVDANLKPSGARRTRGTRARSRTFLLFARMSPTLTVQMRDAEADRARHGRKPWRNAFIVRRRLIAIGDLHGDVHRLVRILQRHEVFLPGTRKWAKAANTVDVVLLGDYVDWRGE
ncbi:MAG: hypothetical protein EB084_16955, partial [Proteobacteria bacterium]|nr:hypothetical protein [Pseudomonadota bacterium]